MVLYFAQLTVFVIIIICDLKIPPHPTFSSPNTSCEHCKVAMTLSLTRWQRCCSCCASLSLQTPCEGVQRWTASGREMTKGLCMCLYVFVCVCECCVCRSKKRVFCAILIFIRYNLKFCNSIPQTTPVPRSKLHSKPFTAAPSSPSLSFSSSSSRPQRGGAKGSLPVKSSLKSSTSTTSSSSSPAAAAAALSSKVRTQDSEHEKDDSMNQGLSKQTAVF